MNKSQPKVSVLMSVYNGSQYLRESVESILNQTFTNFEFIIINDCSTDKTGEILTVSANQDNRITLINNEENIGLTRSLNKGLKIAKGEYIARQDADDISLPERLERQVESLDKNPEAVLISCDLDLINAKGDRVGSFRRSCDSNLVAWYLLFYNHLAGHSQVMFRRKSVLNLGGYAENYRYCQDYELWCRLVKIGRIIIRPEVLLQQRFHSQSISSDKKTEQKSYALKQVQDNICNLINREISLKEAEKLSGFWIGHWWQQCFPSSSEVRSINLLLQEISKAFIQKEFQQFSSSVVTYSQLKNLISQQFMAWIQVPFNKRHSLKAKLRISYYALAWSPLGVLKSWIILLWKSKSYLLKAIIRLPQNLKSEAKGCS